MRGIRMSNLVVVVVVGLVMAWAIFGFRDFDRHVQQERFEATYGPSGAKYDEAGNSFRWVKGGRLYNGGLLRSGTFVPDPNSPVK